MATEKFLKIKLRYNYAMYGTLPQFYDLQTWQYVRSLLMVYSFIFPFADSQDDKEVAIAIAVLIFVSWSCTWLTVSHFDASVPIKAESGVSLQGNSSC